MGIREQSGGPIIGAVVWFVAKDYLTNERSTVHTTTETYLIASAVIAVLCAHSSSQACRNDERFPGADVEDGTGLDAPRPRCGAVR